MLLNEGRSENSGYYNELYKKRLKTLKKSLKIAPVI